jgi:hypothetical protein
MSNDTELKLQQGSMLAIYQHLAAGNSIQMLFADGLVAESFRTSFHVFKRRQDETLLAVGFINEAEVETFSFKYNEANKEAYLSFKKKEPPQYSFFIIPKAV